MPHIPRFRFSKNDVRVLFGIISQIVAATARAALVKARPIAQWAYAKFVEFARRADPLIVKAMQRTAEPRRRAGVILDAVWRFIREAFQIAGKVAGFPFRLIGALVRGLLRAMFGEVSIELGRGGLIGGLGAVAENIRGLVQGFRDRIRTRLEESSAVNPAVFRTTAALGLVMFCWFGACSTFALFTRVGRIDVTVLSPAATKLEDGAVISPVEIRFSGSAARLDLIGKTVGVVLDPPARGSWTFRDDRTLVFQPEEDWPSDQKYSVSLDKGLFAVNVALSDWSPSFRTAPFEGKIDEFRFYIDPKDPSIKKVIGTISFTHPVDADSLEKNTELTHYEGKLSLGGKRIGFKISLDRFQGKAYLQSDVIPVPEKAGTVKLAISSGVRSAKKTGRTASMSSEAQIPGRFSMLAVTDTEIRLVRNDHQEYEQIFFLHSTGKIARDELARNLTLYALPKDKPETPGNRGEKDYSWNNPAEVGPEVLALAEKLKPEAMTEEFDDQNMYGFRIRTGEKRHIYFKVAKGTKAWGDYVLEKDRTGILLTPEFQREIRIMHDGAILSLSGEKKLSVMSYDNDTVEFDVGRVLPDQINHLVSQSGGNYRSPYFKNVNFTDENISEHYAEKRVMQKTHQGRLQYVHFDFSRYLTERGPRLRNGLFYLRVTGMKKEVQKKKEAEENENDKPQEENGRPEGSEESNPDESSDGSNRSRSSSDRRLILITDLGILVKEAQSGSHDVFVQSFSTGHPVAGATVEVIGKNGIVVAARLTDNDGLARFPSLADFKREKEPTAYVVRLGSDLSFMPFGRQDRSLNLSRFDVGGLQGADLPDRLNAFLFSDRGIYRPGDEIRSAMIVKAGDWTRGLAGIPLEVSVTDPRGLEVHSQKIRLSAFAFEEVRYRTEETSPTGNYEIGLYLIKDKKRGSLIGSTRVRVEEFLPDKLKITARLSREIAEDEGWVSPKDLKGQVRLMNLFGSPAQFKRVAGTMTLIPRFPRFKGFADYQFYDPMRTERTFKEELGDISTDAEGNAEFPLPLHRFDGMYRITFHADGFESDGGRAVSSESSVVVSPLSFVIGVKADGDTSYLRKGARRQLAVIALDSGLRSTQAPGIKVKIVEERHVSTLMRRSDGIYQYQSVKKEISVKTMDFPVPAGGAILTLPTEQAGDFVVSFFDAQNVEVNKLTYSVVGEGNVTRSLERNAELNLKLNRADYGGGEQIEVSVRAPYTGSGLITIEKDKVYAHRWFHAGTESSVQRIVVPGALEGNGYVNVSYVRAIDSREIFASPLSYGVAPFSVSKNRRTARVFLDTPAQLKAGQLLRMRVSADRPSRMVLYAVDEGILQVAKYRTPDPLSHFFQKRALEVKTSQILDQLLPEFSIVQALARTGGDADRIAGLNLNPFKRKRNVPVVYWSGVVDVGPQAREFTYELPGYFNGRVRIVALAVSESAVGVAEKSMVVKDDLILSPSVAAFASPGDEMVVSVNVSNQIPGSGKGYPVQLTLAVDGTAQISGESRVVLNVDERGEKTASFKIQGKSPGEGRLTFTAQAGNSVSHQTETVSIRPPTPYITDVQAGILEKDSVEIPIQRKLYPELAKLEVSVSPLPLALSAGLFQYLDSYPYGCTEQITSRAFGALILKSRPELGPPAKSDELIANTMRVLRARQNQHGAFGFWSANSEVSEWQSVYAMQFLTEAKERGVAVPDDLFDRGIEHLKKTSNGRTEPPAEEDVRAYAAYILARNGLIVSDPVNSVIQRLQADKDLDQKLPGLYLAASFQLMKKDKEAETWIKNSKPTFSGLRFLSDYYDPVSGNARYLNILARHFPSRFGDLAGSTLRDFLDPLKYGRYNTVSSSLSILALDSYIELARSGKNYEAAVTQSIAGGVKETLAMPPGLFPKVRFSKGAEKLVIASRGDAPAFYQVTVAGYDQHPPELVSDKVEVSREITDLNNRTIAVVPVGSEVLVHIRIRAKKTPLWNMAIVDILPGGFEPSLEGRSDEAAKQQQALKNRFQPSHMDIREDRVILFGQASTDAQEYTYRIRAVNRGEFTVPPLFAEAMYDRSIRAVTATSRISIQERKADSK